MQRTVPLSAQDLLCLSGCILGARETWPLTAKTPTSPQGKDSRMSFTEQMYPRHAGVTWLVSTHFNHAACVKSWFFTRRKKFYHAGVFLHQVKVWTSLPWQNLCNIQFLWVPQESFWNTNVLWFFRCLMQASQTYFYWYFMAASFAKYSYQIYGRLFLSDIKVGNPFCWDMSLIMLVPRSPCP